MEEFRKDFNKIHKWFELFMVKILEDKKINSEELKRKTQHYATDLRRIIECLFMVSLIINKKNYNKKIRKMAQSHSKKNEFLDEMEKIDKNNLPKKILVSGKENEHWTWCNEWNDSLKIKLIYLYKNLSDVIHLSLFVDEKDEKKHYINALINIREANNFLKYHLTTHIIFLYKTNYIYFISISDQGVSGNIFSNYKNLEEESNLNINKLRDKEFKLIQESKNQWNKTQDNLSILKSGLYHLFIDKN